MLVHDGSSHAATAVLPLTGPVKWFNQDKGFGFVLVDQPARDAFLHVTVLRRAGFGPVTQGDRVTCIVENGGRGLTVREVLGVEQADRADEGSVPATVQVIGRVKFYDLERGFGFVRGDDGREVFVGSKLLRRLGIAPLRADQTVKVTAIAGDHGLVAETLTFMH